MDISVNTNTIVSSLLVVAVGFCGKFIWDTNTTIAQMDIKLSNLQQSLSSPDACLGGSVCSPEYEAHKDHIASQIESLKDRVSRLED